MTTQNTALSSDRVEPNPQSDRGRRSLLTLPDVEPDAEPQGFEPHDTIPAPPWLDEPTDEQAPAQASREG
jgi:hypothetical protein